MLFPWHCRHRVETQLIKQKCLVTLECSQRSLIITNVPLEWACCTCRQATSTGKISITQLSRAPAVSSSALSFSLQGCHGVSRPLPAPRSGPESDLMAVEVPPSVASAVMGLAGSQALGGLLQDPIMGDPVLGSRVCWLDFEISVLYRMVFSP